MIDKYKKACTEALEIISHLPIEEQNKIPKEKIDYLKENMDVNYSCKIDPKVSLHNQEISDEAYSILTLIFNDYFATERQKGILKKMLSQNQLTLQVKRQKNIV